ncbi:halocyanin domain-containing protein [Halorarius halobius]|uniref:halocyanin domain-containing protein n=1 Tax=Halorarius halobius TaxID=2962671 RepID=UPI0020CF1858|nr:halocyanin domain-containing protein [Halorarius halobius]
MISDDGTPHVTRRTLLAATGTAAVAAGAGVAGAQDAPYGGWFTDSTGGATETYDGTVDRTGQSEVTVEVGAQGNGGPYAFAPTAMRVDPGTTVTFSWVSDTHNVVVESQPEGAGWAGQESVENTGFEFSHTFETEGVYTYYCEPHLSLGMKGAVVVGDAEVGESGGGGGGGNVRPDFGDWLTQDGEQVDGGFMDARGQSEVQVEVGADGNGGTFAFAPANLWVDPGTTVRFTWTSDSHNVVVESQPDGAGWEGEESVENTGFEFSHTFETGGMYEYFCDPHLSLGMKGGVAVGDDVPTREISTPAPAGGEGGDGEGFVWPGGEFSAVLLGFIWSVGGLGALLLLGGEFYRDRQKRLESRPEPTGPPTEAAAPEPVTEIGHDEYDPVGTAILIAAFFLVLVVMWVFVYFVEFLGNGPTVLG